MDQVLYDRILSYLLTRKQPEGLTRIQRISLWSESRDYVVERGELVYKKNNSKVYLLRWKLVAGLENGLERWNHR